MSTAVEIPLQAGDSKEVEDGSNTKHTEPLDDSRENANTKGADYGQGFGTSPNIIKWAMRALTTCHWKTVFTAVAILIAYGVLNAGNATIAPFYPIVTQQLHIPVYISGFVIGTAPLCTAVTSPLIGYFFNLSVGIIGVIYFCSELVHAMGIMSAGPITDKLKKPRYLIIAGLAVGFSAVLFIGPPKFITSPQLWLSILAWLVFEFGLSFAVVPVYPDLYGIAKAVHGSEDEADLASEDEADLASNLSGIIVASISAGECLGPILGGAIVYKVGFRSMTAIFGLILLVHALVLISATVVQRVWKSRTCWKFSKSNKQGSHESN